MKEKISQNNNIRSVNKENEDQLEMVLAEGERILDWINEQLECIKRRKEQMELTYKQLDGMLYFMEWKLEKFEKEGIK